MDSGICVEFIECHNVGCKKGLDDLNPMYLYIYYKFLYESISS